MSVESSGPFKWHILMVFIFHCTVLQFCSYFTSLTLKTVTSGTLDCQKYIVTIPHKLCLSHLYVLHGVNRNIFLIRGRAGWSRVGGVEMKGRRKYGRRKRIGSSQAEGVNMVSRNSQTPGWCWAIGVPSQTPISGHFCERVTRIFTWLGPRWRF